MSTHAEDSAYALLSDGATVEIRAARPDDFDAVRDMHAKMSPDNLYLRFFSMSPLAAEQEARRICREPAPDHAALLAVLDGEVVGCGTYERAGAGSRSAEVAFTVADDLHNRGIGMLLLEHLVSLARGRGLRAFTAETLSENAAMLRVFADAGLQAQRSLADGVYDLTFPLPADEADAALGTYRDTVAVRERSADVASMRPVLTPASVAVIGASRRPGSVGRAILRNIITGGFSGPVYPVNPGAAELDGIPCLPSAAALPEHGRPGGHRRPGRGGARCRRGVRAAGSQGPGGDRGGAAAARPARSCWASAAATACGWSGRPASAWPTPASAWTPRSRPAIPRREQPAWRCSPPAAPGSCWWSTCPGWASGSPPSSRSATKTTCPAPTCCSGGSPTRRPSWPCCTWNRSGTRPSSPAPPAASAAPCRS